MAYSMTGFGRGESFSANYSFSLEVKSVNNRYLDINLRMPRELQPLEEKVRKVVQTKVKRGRVEIFVSYKEREEMAKVVELNKTLAKGYINSFKELAREFELEEKISAYKIATLPEVLTVSKDENDLDEMWSVFEKSLLGALAMLLENRKNEAKDLLIDVNERLIKLKDCIDFIEKKSPIVLEEHKEKINKKLKEFIDKGGDWEENRILMECAVLAEKSDVTEEIVRFNSHLQAFKDTLQSGDVIGRKLDFTIQELNREINTIASKTSDYKISEQTIEVKSELEKIREQVQNIE